MKAIRHSIAIHVLALLACALLFGCSKKNTTPLPINKTVLTGYYSLTGLYTINTNGTYTAKPITSCLTNFSMNLQTNNLMQMQDNCFNITGTWSYTNNILTVTEGNGTVLMQGAVQFETDGITIDVNNTIDNTRYQLFRN
jgi:hypothetical protein